MYNEINKQIMNAITELREYSNLKFRRDPFTIQRENDNEVIIFHRSETMCTVKMTKKGEKYIASGWNPFERGLDIQQRSVYLMFNEDENVCPYSILVQSQIIQKMILML